jgi:choline dehydrogenase-like flavoprotein
MIAPAATTRLRAADASAFPEVISANTKAMVCALVAKASDPIGGEARRTPLPSPSPSP